MVKSCQTPTQPVGVSHVPAPSLGVSFRTGTAGVGVDGTVGFVVLAALLVSAPDRYLGLPIAMGDPQNGWFRGENHGKSIYKWMMTGGTPISGNLHIVWVKT